MTTISSLIDDVTALRDAVLEAEARQTEALGRVLDRHLVSARNLIHYVEVRSHDLRELQARLSDVGISSLGRMEAGVLGHLETVLRALRAQLGHTPPPEPAEYDDQTTPVTPAQGRQILEANATQLLGPERPERSQRIMVTMPSEAADDEELVRGMVEAGMDLARINCAHDDEAAWAAMTKAVRSYSRPDGYMPLVAMDLAGPKLRTGPLEPGPEVLKIRPRRDVDGQVLKPALVSFGDIEHDEATALPLAGDAQANRSILEHLQAGEELRLTDARGSSRKLRVEEAGETGVVVSAKRTIYWSTGTEVHTDHGTLVIGDLPEVEQSMRVHIGDEIVLTRSMEPRPAVAESPFVIGCSLTEPFKTISTGDRVLFDDGKITAMVTAHSDDEIRVQVEEAAPNGTKLKAEKGINFPDTDLGLAALTAEDLSHIPFVAQHADMVNMSFVHKASDVAELMDALAAEDAQHVDITLKIETVEAFEQLPRMLLEAMRWDNIGVMIARGDLAVEAGFARMAELQEEILWLCEAAHVPSIWATQVLESLAKSGLPSRAEITDAASAQRAEGVMLNKGPFITEAITELSDILHRMGSHADKKRDMLRELRSWNL
ncbi:pyruvate kinase [Enteractinococcus fodinae]|uniref:pyruvate kinase n=1 Tax=Enteractinococcus fodinae TaxID=684663 RepID=A0ABU2B013_9MICC|nr:pyruvate kinase [Enteractinococcus fodinae]MDR7346606.1 pyruvate kinase [Enteractinococcus fodinae]